MIARIQGCTRTLGAPPDWTPESSGACVGLPIRDGLNGDMPSMTSAWEPTPEELEALANGAKVLLTVLGGGHPPVRIDVGEVPE